MSKRKGLSFDEKRERLLEIFYEKQEVFTLKELEKLGPKLKGIIEQTVKEVLQSLQDDNLVEFDKIGSANYFWAFPSQAGLKRRRRIEQLTQDIEKAENQKETLKQKIEEASSLREETAGRMERLAVLSKLEVEVEKNRAEVQRFADSDPEVFRAKEAATKVAVEAANRWTDNLFTAKKYCVQTFNMDSGVFDEQFNVPAELDYI